MVQHSFQLLFLSLFAATLVSLFPISLGEPVKRTVETDIAIMAAQITSLDSVVDQLSAVGILSPISASVLEYFLLCCALNELAGRPFRGSSFGHYDRLGHKRR